MFRTKLFRRVIFFFCLLAVLDYIGQTFHLFVVAPLFDVPMHFLGGFFVALVALLLDLWRQKISFLRSLSPVFSAIILVLIVGILWECYELLFNITFFSDGIVYVFDTTKDLLMDIIGGLFGAWYALRIQRNG